MGKRSLQIATAFAAMVPVTVGSLALYFGVRSPIYNVIGECVTATLDSNFRFMAGLWLGLAFALACLALAVWLRRRRDPS